MTEKATLDFCVDRIDRSRARKAVELYYKRFYTNNSLTINEAASMRGITGLEVHLYIADTKGLGIPDNREQVQEHLRRLQELDKQS